MTDHNAQSGRNSAPSSGASNPKGNETTAPQTTNWFQELRGLSLMLLGVLAFHSLVAKPFYIPSISMMPNLLVGDRLIVSKFPYGWNWSSASFHLLPRSEERFFGSTPEYGDIVIVVPRNRNADFIKRVVALPGDRIAVIDGRIRLNGKFIEQTIEPSVQIAADDALQCEGQEVGHCYDGFEPYRTRLPSGRDVYELPTYRETLPNGANYQIIDYLDQPLDHYPEITVPADHVFLMGDDRDRSADSRAPFYINHVGQPDGGLGGPVPLSDIGGRAEFITFSLDGTQTWNPLSWWQAMRGSRAFSSLRPALTPAQDSGTQ